MRIGFWSCVTGLLLFSKLSAQAPHDSIFIKKITTVLPVADLEIELIGSKSDSDRILSLVRLSLSTFSRNDRKNYAQRAVEIAQQNGDEFCLALACLAKAGAATTRTQIDSSMNVAISIFSKSNDHNLIWLTKLQAASSFFFIEGNYVQSFTLLNQFVNNYSIPSDHDSFSMAWNRLGEIYRILQNYDKALECYHKSVSHARQVMLRIAPLINIGTVYKNTKRYDSALAYYDKAMKFYFRENASMKPYIEFREAQVYLDQKDLARAIILASRSLRQYDSLNNPLGIALAASVLAQSNFMLNKYPECILYGKKSIETGKSIGYFSEGIEEACQVVAASYERMGKYKEANEYLKYQQEVRDKFFGPKVNLSMFREQLQLEINNQELEKSLLNLKQQQAENIIRVEKNIIIAAAIALLGFVFISLKLYRRNKTIIRLNRQLQEKSDEILAQAEELRATNEEMESLNANLESLVKERSEKVIEQNQRLLEYAYFNAHKVRGPLARILGLVNILQIELTNAKICDISRMLKQSGEELDASIREINNVLDASS